MTEQESFSRPLAPEQAPQLEALNPMMDIDLQGEKFKTQHGYKNVVEVDGKRVNFSVDLYHHTETGMEIEVYSLGMQRPLHEPTIIRADYGCPCMNFPSKYRMQGHDCAQQRDLMFDTMRALGTGVVAVISEQTAAGNGHGKHAVHGQATLQYEAEKNGQHIPTMEEAHSQMGYYNDIRRHDIVAKVLAATVGDRPALSTTSNTEKIQQFENAGIHIIPNTRVELVTSQSLNRQSLLGRRNYDHIKGIHKPGAYLVNGHTLRLTPKTYQEEFIQPVRPEGFMRRALSMRRPRRMN